MSFKLPVLIPTTVSFGSWPDGPGRGFALHDAKNEKPHLTGSVRPLSGRWVLRLTPSALRWPAVSRK